MTVEMRPGHAPAGSMLSLEEARGRMLDGVAALPAETVDLVAARERVLAAQLASRLTMPPWDNSAMDGFAVRAADVEVASDERPIQLRVTGEAAAGRAVTAGVGEGQAMRILTGAPLPPGADAVVPVEETDAQPGVAELPAGVAIRAPVVAGAHIRRRGSDLRAGDPLLPQGSVLDAASMAVAAAGGHGSAAVHRRPRVGILATGDELAPAGSELSAAQIPDSNSVGLGAQAAEVGAEVRPLGIAADRLAEVVDRLRPALEWADVIVVSGGVSVGAHDVVKEAFAQLGRLDIWRVAVQPGKPLAFGRAPRSGGRGEEGSDTDRRQGEVLLFGLPGNPVSSFVTFELFVRPVLRRLAGHHDLLGREVVRARLGQPVTKSANRRAFLRVRLTPAAEQGMGHVGWLAELAGGQGSHVLSALALADGLAIVGEDVDALPAGAEVDVIRLRPAPAAVSTDVPHA